MRVGRQSGQPEGSQERFPSRGIPTAAPDKPGNIEIGFEDTWAHYCVHPFNSDGLIREKYSFTARLGA